MEDLKSGAIMTREELVYLSKRADVGRKLILQQALEPNKRKEPPRFSAGRAADLLGKTRQSVGKMLKDVVQKDTRRKGGGFQSFDLSQDDLDALRKHYNLDERPPGGAPVVCVLNQKGGVGKTTTVLHLAMNTALKGYRTLVLDLDSQASFTTFMGPNPDVEIQDDETLLNIIIGKQADMRPLIRPAPHVKNLWFVPSCLEFNNANELAYHRQVEVNVTRALAEKHGFKYERDSYVFFDRLRRAIDKVRGDYDVIILDCPPHVSATTYNGAYAADFLLVPLGATMLDFASTLRFIDWLNTVANSLPGVAYQRIRFLITNYEGSAAHENARYVIQQVLGDHLLQTNAVHSSEIQRAAAELKTIYEVQQPIGSRDAWSRACQSMDEVNAEVINNIEQLWQANRKVAEGALA
jgi:chromosome partitioning protein